MFADFVSVVGELVSRVRSGDWRAGGEGGDAAVSSLWNDAASGRNRRTSALAPAGAVIPSNDDGFIGSFMIHPATGDS